MVVKFMGIPAPHFTARLSFEEREYYRDEAKFEERKARWEGRAAIEITGKQEKNKWWWQNENGEWVGKCSNPTCENGVVIKAVGLVHVEGKRVRSTDGIKVSDEAHFCMECRPRLFGRVGGRASRGIPMWGPESGEVDSDC